MAAISPTVGESSAVNLTSTSTNTMALPTTTPRQGGFTLTNRWDCSKLASAYTWNTSAYVDVSAAGDDTLTVVPFYVLKVPKRTTVKSLHINAMIGETAPDHAVAHNTSSADATSGDFTSWSLTLGGAAWKKDTQTSIATFVGGLGIINLTANDGTTFKGSIAGSPLNASWSGSASSSISVPTVAGLTPRVGNASNANGANAYVTPLYFPHGGYVSMRFDTVVAAGLSYSSASDLAAFVALTASMSGVGEVQADCSYVPE